jgi:hypothetical protein
MTREGLTNCYLDSGWEIWEDVFPRIKKFRRGGLIAVIVEFGPDDWRSHSLWRGHELWAAPLTQPPNPHQPPLPSPG